MDFILYNTGNNYSAIKVSLKGMTVIRQYQDGKNNECFEAQLYGLDPLVFYPCGEYQRIRLEVILALSYAVMQRIALVVVPSGKRLMHWLQPTMRKTAT